MEFRKPKVLVLGDLMLDLWVEAKPRAGNPEGAAAVFQGRNADRFETLGGAGLVATLLRCLGLRTKLMARCGHDAYGDLVHTLLHENQLTCKHVSFVEELVTPAKMRFVNDHGIVVFRYDEESSPEIYMADYSAHFSFEAFEKLVKFADAVVIADYGKGYCQEVGPKIIEAAKYYGALSIVGAKPALLNAYRGADIVKVNVSEAAAYLTPADNAHGKDVAAMCEMLCARMESCAAVITGGNRGAYYTVKNEHGAYVTANVPAQQCAPVIKNCVGAGDAFLAGMTASLLQAPVVEAPGFSKTPLAVERIQLAAVSGGAVAAQYLSRGYPTVDAALPLLAQFNGLVAKSADAKIVSPELGRQLGEAWRSSGGTVVFTNGCFDLLHRGHVHLLEQAKKQGTHLIVAVNTDASVRALKGDNRPVQDLQTRAKLLANLSCVDAVVLLDEEDFTTHPALRGLISTLLPDVLVKGAQYKETEIVGWDEMVNRDPPGRVWCCPMVDNCSTTQTIAKVVKNDE